MTTATDSPRIYVACLSSYNAGRLYGRWIELAGMDGDDIRAEIDAMLKDSPMPGAEEYAVHDFEGLKLDAEWSALEWLTGTISYWRARYAKEGRLQ